MLDYKEALKHCIKCGACMSVCPVYQATRMETDVARGKLAVLQEVVSGGLAASGVSEVLSRCLLCGACADVCANHVQSDILIQYGRQQDFFKRKPALPQWLLQAITFEELAPHILIKGSTLLEKILCKHVPASSGLHLRFPLAFFMQRAIIPQIASTSFLEGCPPENKEAHGNIRVGFFIGCGTNYLFPDIGYAVLEILREASLSPFIPEQQGCCGLMAYTSGDQKKAAAQAKHTIDLFSNQGLDYILTTCASCGAQLKTFPELFSMETERRQAERFSEKVMDATSFLIDVMGYERLAQSTRQRPQEDKGTSRLVPQEGSTLQKKSEDSPIRVVYHDPCHLRIKQKVMDAPRRFLETIPGIELTELPTPDQCCGHGGTFNLSNFSLSMEILDRKMSEIEQVKPDKIVTGCTGCLLQFEEGVRRIKTEKRIEVLHPLVLWRQQCLEEEFLQAALYDK